VTRTAAVVLAAGGSSRMGRPKQLLPFAGTSLVRHAARVALNAGCDPVCIVIGANADAVRPELDGFPVSLVSNPEWEAGPGTSVRAGVAALAADVDAVVFLLCDQPLVTAEHVRNLATAHADTGLPIVASGYSGTAGVPALFARACFAEVLAVASDAGAKRVIACDPARVAVVPFPPAAADVDMPADYEQLRSELSPEVSYGPGQ
jgi:molybdenum cofactor cytidylyltransferase